MIGRFDILATIQSLNSTVDAMGNPAGVWSDAGTRWCELIESGGRELYVAQQVNAQVTAIITLREQFAGLTQKHRLIFTDHNGNARVFHILGISGRSGRDARQGPVLAVMEAA